MNHKLLNNIFKSVCYSVLLLMVIALGLYTTLGFESYCWWNPSIDTVYAGGFNESGFDKIIIGMQEDDVIKLIGYPLGENHKNKEETIVWYYTNDGKAGWRDWAWLGRQVHFNKNMLVTDKVKSIFYD